MYDLTVKLRKIFYSLCKRNDKTGLTSQLFEKLYNRNVIKNSGVQKIDLTLAFQAATVGTAGGQRSVNLINFFHLMLKFHELKLVG